jgi:hypothetical protein
MNGPLEGATSTVARSCNAESDPEGDRDPACFLVSRDDSSRNVTVNGPEYTDVSEPRAEPSTSDEAIRLAIKLAVDAGEYERAAALLDVAKRTSKPGSVTTIDSGPGRDRR